MSLESLQKNDGEFVHFICCKESEEVRYEIINSIHLDHQPKIQTHLPIRDANILGRLLALALLLEDGNDSPKSEETTVDGHPLPLAGGFVAGRLFHPGTFGTF